MVLTMFQAVQAQELETADDQGDERSRRMDLESEYVWALRHRLLSFVTSGSAKRGFFTADYSIGCWGSIASVKAMALAVSMKI